MPLMTSTDAGTRARKRKALLGVLALALVVRGGVFAVNHPFPPPDKDDAVYDSLGWNLIHGHGFTADRSAPYEPMAARTPGYPAFLGAVYVAAGRNPDAVRIVQIALSLVTCLLIYALAGRLMGERRAILAVGVYAVWPAAAHYPSLLLTEANQALLLTAALYFAYRMADAPGSWRWYVACAVTLAAATLVRPDTQLLIVGLLGLVFLLAVNRGVVAYRSAATLALFALLLAPWAARNYSTFGRYLGLATGSGHTMLVAQLEAEGMTHDKLTRVLQERYGEAFERKHGRTMTHLDGALPDEDDERRRDAVAFIKAHPMTFAEHSAERVATFWGPRSWSDAFGLEKDFSQYSAEGRFDGLAAKAGLLLVDAALIGLTLIGFAFALFEWRRFGLLLIVPLYFSLIYGLVYSGARYRVPLLPVAAITAVYGASRVVELAERARKSATSALGGRKAVTS